jgi:hypothetical protein
MKRKILLGISDPYVTPIWFAAGRPEEDDTNPEQPLVRVSWVLKREG